MYHGIYFIDIIGKNVNLLDFAINGNTVYEYSILSKNSHSVKVRMDLQSCVEDFEFVLNNHSEQNILVESLVLRQ